MVLLMVLLLVIFARTPASGETVSSLGAVARRAADRTAAARLRTHLT